MKIRALFLAALLLFGGPALLLTGCDNKKQSTASSSSASSSSQQAAMTKPVPLVASEHMLDHNIVHVIDGSGSMDEHECSGNNSKLKVAKAAVRHSVLQQPPTTNVGLVVFDAFGDARIVTPLQGGGHEDVVRGIDAIRANNGTPLYQAVELGARMLTERMAQQGGYGRYTLVITTDGEANSGYTPAQVGELAKSIATQYPIQIAVLGFCMQKHALNLPGYTTYVMVGNPDDLERGLAEAVAEAPAFDTTLFR